jgi:ABC-2 type transport system permease protein
MSRRRAIWLVARREILERGRSRAFLISLGLSVVIILAGVLIPGLIGAADGGLRAGDVGVVGTPPARFEANLAAVADQSRMKITLKPMPDLAAAEAAIKDDTLDAALEFPAGGGSPNLVVEDRGNPFIQALSNAVVTSRARALLESAGIDPAELAAAAAPPTIRELTPSDPNRDTSFLFANVGVILLFISIFTFGTWVLTGVVEEKQSRVVEVVLSTVAARDLLMGKVLGIGLLGLVQLTAMVAVGLGAGIATGRFSLPPTTGAAVIQLFLWFGLGYAFYSTALGVLGALASRMEEASNASAPVSILASVAYIFALLVATDDPGGLPARIATFIPPVSPMVVPLRAALGAIDLWEIVLSIGLMVATIWLLFVVGARIYSGAVLRTGAKIGLRDAWRTSRQ